VAKIVRKTKDEFLGTSGAASFLGVEFRTVYRHVAAGWLPCVRDDKGRRIFKLSDLAAYKRKIKFAQQGFQPNRVQ
jgi:excisionase family DNA binding protein